MTDNTKYDDPIWEYTLVSRLTPYIEAVRDWWSEYDKLDLRSTCVYPIEGEDVPPGLMARLTNTPARSPVKGVQAFPFVPTSYLNLTGIAGGYMKMIERVCAKGLTLEEFKVIEKHNLPSTYHRGQILIFVPVRVLEDTESLGRFVHVTKSEALMMLHGEVPPSMTYKLSGKFVS